MTNTESIRGLFSAFGFRHSSFIRISGFVILVFAAACFAEDPKTKVAVFPLGGTADPIAREKVGFSLRQKIDREGTYEVIDGPTMADLAEGQTFTFDTKLDVPEKLAKQESADVMIWGELNADKTLRVKVFDRRQLDPLPHQLEKQIAQPTDMRFIAESVVEMLEGVKAFEHPNEVAVQHDEVAERLWQENPNLVVNGGFDKGQNWHGIYQSEYYMVKLTDAAPEVDKIAIWRLREGTDMMTKEGLHVPPVENNVLAMNLSKTAAENNGLACLSDAIKIEPNTRYRLSFRYKSDGPRLHVFIKGYTIGKNIEGKEVEREIYRRQVPPTGATNGEWVTIVDELNPQHSAFPVQVLKVDLYAYLQPGMVMFDDVVLKAVGTQTRVAKDKAIKPPATPPK
jgi:hypothetical protein